MSNFLEGYEDVNARIIRARKEFPTLRLVAYIEDIDITKGYVLIRAEAYKEYEDHLPSAVDYAEDIAAQMLASSLGIPFDATTNWVEKRTSTAVNVTTALTELMSFLPTAEMNHCPIPYQP